MKVVLISGLAAGRGDWEGWLETKAKDFVVNDDQLE